MFESPAISFQILIMCENWFLDINNENIHLLKLDNFKSYDFILYEFRNIR